MGRVKLQIKKIENTTNRQVTYSKRRNGLIKKAYELSVLCDVDIALIMFSPSGRLSVFSGGNKSIEEIVTRYVNLPEHERLHNQEYIEKTLAKLKSETDTSNQVISPLSGDSYQVEVRQPWDIDQMEIQQEILRCKSQLEDMEKRLRIYEGDPWDINTICEAEYRQQVLENTLNQVRARKVNLAQQPAAVHVNGFTTRSESSIILDWLPHPRDQDPMPTTMLNFLNPAGLLPLSDREGQGDQSMENRLPAISLTLPPQSHMNTTQDMHAQQHQQQLLNDQNNPNSKIEDDPQLLLRPPRDDHSHFGQIIDVNLSPWTTMDLYPTGSESFPTGQPKEGAFLEQFLSQLAPVNHDQIDDLQ